MRARQLPVNGDAFPRDVEFDATVVDSRGADVGITVGARGESHHAPHLQPPQFFAPKIMEAVIGVQHRDSVRAETLENLGFGCGHALQVGQAGQMRRRDIVDERDIWARQAGQIRNFAGVVHAHLDDRVGVRFAQAQQRQRHAPLVVETGARREAIAAGVENRRDQRGDGGLAVAASDRHHRQVEAPPPVRAERAQGRGGVADMYSGEARGPGIARHQRRDRTARRGRADEVMPVAAAATVVDGDEQVAGPCAARVGGDAGKTRFTVAPRIRAAYLPARHRRDFGQTHHFAASRAKAAAATERSLNSNTRAPTLCVLS